MPEDVVERTLAAVDAELPAMLDDLRALVAIDTSFPPGAGYAEWATHLEHELRPLGFDCERVSVPEDLWQCEGSQGERINLVARRAPVAGAPLCLYFHSDTVPAGEGWTTAPFALTRRDNRLYGRGTADMKGAVAAALGAIRALDRADAPYEFDPVLLFCTDEEGGLYPGARYLAEVDRIEGPVLCLNGQAAPRLWAGCFGSLDLRVRLEGRAAHSSSPNEGVNAIEESLPVLSALTAMGAAIASRTSDLAPPPGRPALRPSLTVTAASGGAKGSALPARFEIVVNRRYMPEENADEAIEAVRACVDAAVARTRLLGFEVELIGHLAPVHNPLGERLWPRWQRSLARGFGWPLASFRAWGSTSSSDMGFIQQHGSEILLGGLAGAGRNVHAADEHTTVDDLVGLARSIALYLCGDFQCADRTIEGRQP